MRHIACNAFAALSALSCRLPQLSQLKLKLTTQAASAAIPAAYAVDTARLQLSGVTSLSLTAHRAWAEADGAGYTWRALGRFTQLQALTVAFTTQSPGFQATQLSALSTLSGNLRSLRITCPGFKAEEQQQDYNALSSLSSLTQLVLPYAAGATGVPAISSCSSLLRLSLSGPAGRRSAGPTLGVAECAALELLTQLTYLRLTSIPCNQTLLSALQRLQQLQVLQVDGLKAADALPALARLPQLKSIAGEWQESAGAAAAAGTTLQLTAVRYLEVAGTCAPFQTFPGVKTVLLFNTCQPGDLTALSQHCKQLQLLGMGHTWRMEASTLAPAAPVAQRTAAVASLAALRHLRSLFLSVNCDAEISALAAASQLRQLTLFVPTTNRTTRGCSTIGLAALGLLRSLRQLTLQLPGLVLTAEPVCGLMSSMQRFESVEVCVVPGQEEGVDAGLELALERHIRVPAAFKAAIKNWPRFIHRRSINLGLGGGILVGN